MARVKEYQICEYVDCHNLFQSRSRGKRGPQRFCSPGCSHAARPKKVRLVCSREGCNKSFEDYDSHDRKYCSHRCSAIISNTVSPKKRKSYSSSLVKSIRCRVCRDAVKFPGTCVECLEARSEGRKASKEMNKPVLVDPENTFPPEEPTIIRTSSSKRVVNESPPSSVDWSKRPYSAAEFIKEFEMCTSWSDLADRLGLSPTSSSTKGSLDRAALSLGLNPDKLRKVRYSFSDEELEDIVKSSYSYAEVLRSLGVAVCGGNHTHWKKRINNLGLDTSHFKGRRSRKGVKGANRKPLHEILVLGGPQDRRVNAAILRRSLLELGVPLKCNSCGLGSEWEGGPLVLEINHINGEFWDNRLGNLEFLCPNCHSQEVETNKPHKNSDMRLNV